MISFQFCPALDYMTILLSRPSYVVICSEMLALFLSGKNGTVYCKILENNKIEIRSLLKVA